ncbi:MAG: ATP-dependent zinc metalloprotease FtsH [Planctomycetes bacterium]|nr:ATP-dependent zinc metalloprotease FtsH [Planctomycetota bacterium]
MGQLPTSSDPNDHGGKNDPNHTGQSQAYLFTPQSLDDPKLGKTHDITFDDLLAYTTTDAENLSHGLPPVAELTTDLFLTRGRVEFSEDAGLWETLLLSLLPWLLIIGFLWFFIFRQMRSNGVGGNVLSFGKSRARIANREKSSVTFADVAGVDEAKDEVSEIVEFLKHPGRFARLGGRTPRGVLLVGSPGTGKTLLAKAIAGEAEVPFYSICGSDFVEMFVGVGASRVRDLFKQARENSPCIIFLDEIDAVGRRRGAGLGGGHDEREQTLNAILVEMDGFESDTGIIVIAATNRADVLDPALMRPGRFDREIHVDLPDVKGREAILRVHGRRVKLHPGTDLSRIARATPGFSGAELEAVVNEAAILATLGKKDFVYEEDLEEARDRVRWGRAKNSRIMDDEEKKVTAYHEAGHTLIALLSPEADPIHKVTIIPRGQALGATMYLPEKDQYSLTQNKAETYLKICFGGRIAEELFFDSITSGAANDIKQATGVARRMVKEWGMSPALGPISYEDGDDNVFLGRELGRQVKHSEATADAIDQEVKRIVDAAYQSCHQLLSANRDKLELLAKNLLEYEILTRSEIEGLMAGDTVAAIREQAEASRKELEKVAGARAPSLTDPKLGPVGDPEPKFPPGLAGEGA